MTESRWIIDTESSPRLPVYTRMNANDVLSDPISPLGASMCWIPHIFRGWCTGYALTGAYDNDDFAHPNGSGGFYYGCLYVNLSATRLFGLRSGVGVETVDAIWFGGHPDLPPYHPMDGDVNEALSAKVAEFAGWALTTDSYPDIEEDKQIAADLRAQRPNLAAISDAALVARARAVLAYERLTWRGETIGGVGGSIGPGALAQLLAGADPTLSIRLASNAGDVDSAAPAFAMWELSRLVRNDASLGAEFDKGVDGLRERVATSHPAFSAAFEQFLYDFGYRGPNEWDMGSDVWETKPTLPLAMIERMRLLEEDQSPSARRAEQQKDADAAMAEARAFLAGNDEGLATLAMAVSSMHRFAGWRERGKANCVRVLHEARMAMAELGRRMAGRGQLAKAGDIFLALDEELDGLMIDPFYLKDTLAAREVEWKKLFGLDVPMFLDTTKPIPPASSLGYLSAASVEQVTAGEVLTGGASSAGVVRGRARVVLSPDAAGSLEPGDILIAPQTDPSWTPLFVVSGAVVVDVGAPNSHAMIVSRELGIPCVAGVYGASRRIPDGALVEVDGSAGTVTIVDL
jgi:rifampicin phosphotransferase